MKQHCVQCGVDRAEAKDRQQGCHVWGKTNKHHKWIEESGEVPYVVLEELRQCVTRAISVQAYRKELVEKVTALKEEESIHFGYRNGRQVCWSCYGEDYCTHEIKIGVLDDILRIINEQNRYGTL